MRVGGMEEQIEWWRPATAGQDDSGGSGTSVFSLASSVIRKLNHMRYCKKKTKKKTKHFLIAEVCHFPLAPQTWHFFSYFSAFTLRFEPSLVELRHPGFACEGLSVQPASACRVMLQLPVSSGSSFSLKSLRSTATYERFLFERKSIKDS